MPSGSILMWSAALLVWSGWGEELWRRLGARPGAVALALASLGLGSQFNLVLAEEPSSLMINLGGALLPLFFGALVARRLNVASQIRVILATTLIASGLFVTMELLPVFGAQLLLIGSGYFYGLLAAVAGVLLVPSTPGSVLAAGAGVVIADLLRFLQVALFPDGSRGSWGGDLTFDAMAVALLGGMLLAESLALVRRLLPVGDSS